MKYGFVIDNRKCIGCHACTVACKSENDVPIGVNRTWVKQVEKGKFPNTKRLFSVLRCNHCSDAPCVEICPVEALYKREDGIVDFNNDRCIGCKSCMQACPYDALYIDPETNTAAKCNYCTHRVDIGLEPACVVVCPEEAIVSGDTENPDSKISQLLSREQVKVRKPEKATNPNLFYIDADESSLNPSVTARSEQYISSSQSAGVGHYAKFAQKLTGKKNLDDLISDLQGNGVDVAMGPEDKKSEKKRAINMLMEQVNVQRVYDTPDKGILWGWEVSSYILTKALAAGIFLVLFISTFFNLTQINESTIITAGLASLVFLLATGALLVKDLDQPGRFLYVLLRPQWKSWLVRGGYSISLFGGLLTLWLCSIYWGWEEILRIIIYPTAVFAVLVAVYTAFLFAQAKGRDFWQSPALAFHMIIHSLMAGSAFFLIISMVLDGQGWGDFLTNLLSISIAINLFTMLIELGTPHPTEDSKRVVQMILSGRYKRLFWFGVVLIGNVIPLILMAFGPLSFTPAIGLITIVGIYCTEHIWLEAPQRIPLT